MSDINDSMPETGVEPDRRGSQGRLHGPAQPRHRGAVRGLPLWARLPIGLLLVSFAFYLPFLNILPFAYIRTDLTPGGSTGPACCSSSRST